MSQLRALVESSLDHGGYPAAQDGAVPHELTDLASAIDARCLPGLTPDGSSRISTSWEAVQAAARSGADLTAPARDYLTAANALCP
jgi:hypothetical protein